MATEAEIANFAKIVAKRLGFGGCELFLARGELEDLRVLPVFEGCQTAEDVAEILLSNEDQWVAHFRATFDWLPTALIRRQQYEAERYRRKIPEEPPKKKRKPPKPQPSRLERQRIRAIDWELFREGLTGNSVWSVRIPKIWESCPNFGDIHSEKELIDLIVHGEPERLWVRRVNLPEPPIHFRGSFLEGENRAYRSGRGSRYPIYRWE